MIVGPRTFANIFVATYRGNQLSAACRRALAYELRKHYDINMLAALVYYNHARALLRTEPDQRGFMIGSILLS